jgi:DNA-binding PadR family transcriptional regulator
MIGDCGVRGLLELFILVECKHRPSSGKDISQRAYKFSDGGWKPSAGSLYPLLQKMEKEGLIRANLRRQEKGRREIAYISTAKGKKELDEGKNHLEESTKTMMMAINPIIIRIGQEFDEKEMEEAKKFWKAMMEIRSLVIAEKRRELRHKRFVKLFRIATAEIESMKAELGLAK